MFFTLLQNLLYGLLLKMGDCLRFCSQGNWSQCTFTCHFQLGGCPCSLLEQPLDARRLSTVILMLLLVPQDLRPIPQHPVNKNNPKRILDSVLPTVAHMNLPRTQSNLQNDGRLHGSITFTFSPDPEKCSTTVRTGILLEAFRPLERTKLSQRRPKTAPEMF